VDAWGTIQSFNVSKARIRAGDSIVFTCGVTLQPTEDHSLVVHIKKWFPGNTQGWLLTTNEDVEIASQRYEAALHNIPTNNTDRQVKQIEFTIRGE